MRTIWELWKLNHIKIIGFLAIFQLLGMGVVRMIVPSGANSFYTVAFYVLQVLACLALGYIIYTGIRDTKTYLKNKNKPKPIVIKIEDVVIQLTTLVDTLNLLIKELRNKDNDNQKSTKSE